MDRDQLIAEIKKQLHEEMKHYSQNLKNQIPQEQQDQIKDLKDGLSGQIKENPLASVGIAAVVGFFIARMLYKRSND